LERWLSLRRELASVRGYPGARLQSLHSFHSIALLLAPVFPWRGQVGYYGGKFLLYQQFKSTVFVAVRFLNSQRFYWVADADAFRTVNGDRHTFPKPVWAYEPLNFFGKNLISTEGQEWKRHRDVAKPSFNEANVALVWTETVRVVNEWLAQLDDSSNGRDADVDLVPTMIQTTLLILSSAGFGRRVSWDEDSNASPPSTCKLPFRTAVRYAVENVYVYILTPAWFARLAPILPIPYLSKRIREMNDGYADMRRHMMDLVVRARQEIVENEGKSEVTGKGPGGAAILRNLVEANLALDSEHRRLTDDELFSNIFSFLLAGHETSSHSLSFSFVLLALYPEKQQTLFEEVSRLWPGNEPVSPNSSAFKDDWNKLKYTLAFFRETLRLWPAEPRLAKDVNVDTSLPGVHFSQNDSETSLTEGQAYTLPVPAGSVVMLDIWALHHNPLYWGEDVYEFKPERFLDTDTYRWPRHAYMPFSTGARGCIGMRFALAESICMLACVVRQYEILVPADLAGKLWSEQKEALLQWTTGVTLTPTNARIRLRRRV